MTCILIKPSAMNFVIGSFTMSLFCVFVLSQKLAFILLFNIAINLFCIKTKQTNNKKTTAHNPQNKTRKEIQLNSNMPSVQKTIKKLNQMSKVGWADNHFFFQRNFSWMK